MPAKKTPKPAKKQAEKKPEPKPDDFSAALSKLPKDAQERLLNIKSKVDKFKETVLAKFGKYIVGVALLPPSPAQQQMGPTVMPQGMPAIPPSQGQPAPGQVAAGAQPPGQQAGAPQKDQINVLILVDDSDSRKMTKDELRQKLGTIIQDMAREQDKRLAPAVVLLSELWQNCFDGKYDLVQMIALGAQVHDTGMLGAVKIAEVHKSMVIRKFERYIVSYVLAGSLVQGRATEKSDIDVFVVVDDTDVKRMTRAELKDKLRAIIVGMGLEAADATGIRNKINIQVYILTDFWDSIKEANPIIFTFLRDGVPLYDRGTFMPWKHLLQMGRIKPSQEAIDLYMTSGEQVLSRARFKLREIGMEDTFWAILTPTQAALMLYGVPPPTPRETPEVVRDIFVKKERLIEEEYVKILERHIEVRKQLEHTEKKDLSGKEVDALLADADRYLKRLDALFKEITKVKEQQGIVETYEHVVTAIRDALRLEGIERVDDTDIVSRFEDEMISRGKVPAKYLRLLNAILKAKKDYEAGSLAKAEIENAKKDSAEFVRFLIEYMQRKRGHELQRARIRVRYGSRHGEVLLLDKAAFIIHDVEQKEKQVSKAPFLESGRLGPLQAATQDELEQALATAKIPPQTFIREKLFEDLKAVFGGEVHILLT